MTEQSALEATGPDERTYYYWAVERVIQGRRASGLPVSDEFDSREAAEAVREPIKTLHPDARLVRATDFL